MRVDDPACLEFVVRMPNETLAGVYELLDPVFRKVDATINRLARKQYSIGRPWALTRADLDEHFGASIAAQIEQVNAYFGDKLNDLLAAT